MFMPLMICNKCGGALTQRLGWHCGNATREWYCPICQAKEMLPKQIYGNSTKQIIIDEVWNER